MSQYRVILPFTVFSRDFLPGMESDFQFGPDPAKEIASLIGLAKIEPISTENPAMEKAEHDLAVAQHEVEEATK